MKTFRLKKEEVKEKWYFVDASDTVVGRLAGSIATILSGKNHPSYTPGVDSKNYVVVVNCEKVKISGKKAQDKKYFHHTFYPGGLRSIDYERMMNTHPERILEHAVTGMLPKNKLRASMLKRLRIYKGKDHPHSAQKLETLK